MTSFPLTIHHDPGGIRTPSFLSGGLVPPPLSGSTYNGLFHVSDWPPTLMALAGQPIDTLLDGVSHADTLLRKLPPNTQPHRGGAEEGHGGG